jgi:hypothetical protein
VVASRRQGVADELMGTIGGGAPGNKSGGGAHPGRRSTARWCGGARRCPHRREGRRRLRLAPGAAREDERGEGGPK